MCSSDLTANRAEFGGELNVGFGALPAGLSQETVVLAGDYNRLPVLLRATPEAPLAGQLTTMTAELTDKSQPLLNRFRQQTWLVRGSNNVNVWSHYANQGAVAVAQPLPFSIKIVEPKAPLVQSGSKDLRVVAEKKDGEWHGNQWLQKAVLLSFRLNDMSLISGGPGGSSWWDKVPSKFDGWDEKEFRAAGFRAVPNCVVRKSAYIAPGAILMPSFVNLGAYVDSGTMVDTWVTVGSCAQIGKNVHLSGGVGIGGVLEPMQAGPTIIEDNCFIGARSEIVEGVIVEENCVISMGVFIGQSTPIYDRASGEITYGRDPAGSVVVAGSLPKDGGRYSLSAAIIVKRVDAQTRAKTSLNDLLRD